MFVPFRSARRRDRARPAGNLDSRRVVVSTLPGARRKVLAEMADPGLTAYVPALQLEWLANAPNRQSMALDGTLVFADVSGFTPLTEKLARRGKIGAEELTDILNQVFTGLLDEAASFGGDLLKFGGDALLLLFRGDGHAPRAVAAAASMQAALLPFRRFTTNGGNVSLKMSVGVNSGTFDMFLVGQSHRELLVAGPASSLTAELEAEANACQILLGPSTWPAIEGRHVGSPQGPGRLVKGRPDAPRSPLRVQHLGEAASAIPVGLRQHLSTQREGGEHRAAVLSFLQFKGTDDLLAAGGPGPVGAALDDLVVRTQMACERFDVCFLASDVDRNGGKLLMSTGAPRAGADDADRMLHALREIVAGDSPLQIRAGVNRGRAFAVDVGSPSRRTYAVMGDPTNLAARVMGKAEPGSVLATKSVTETLRDRFLLTPVEPFNVKGKTALVEASVVGQALGRAAAHRDLRFVGRDKELALLIEASRRARRDHDQPPIEVVGEPGSGKTRLLDEMQLRVASTQTIRLAATQYSASSPYLALRPALRQLISADPGSDDASVLAALNDTIVATAPDLLELIPLMAPMVGVSVDDTPATAEMADEFRPLRSRVAWVELATRLIEPDGLFLMEDVQWLDPASGALVELLVPALADKGWLSCATRRPDSQGWQLDLSPVETITLSPLPADATESLINEATHAEPLAPHVVAALAERSGGNPLFVQELLEAVARSQDAELPDTVEGLIAARIDRLDISDRAVLNHAAVLGSRIRLEVLTRFVADDADLAGALARLDDFFVHDGEGRLAFRQTLVREVAYEMLPFRARREMHSRAGDLVLDDVGEDVEEFSDLLSLHFVRAQRFAAAWHYARIAADRASRSGAAVEAGRFLERAIEAARHQPDIDPAELAAVHKQLGGIRRFIGDFAGAAEAFKSARRLAARDSFELLILMQEMGRLREQTGQYTEALRWLGRGIKMAANVDSALADKARAGLLTYYGATRMRQGRMLSAIPILEDAVAACERVGDRSFLAHAYYLLDWAHTDLGTPDAQRYRELALPIYEELGDWNGQAKVLNNLGVDAYWEGRWDEAIDYYRRNKEAEVRAGDLVQVVTASNNIGEILSDQGHIDEAVALFEEALRTWRAARYAVGIALATSNLGRAAGRAGRFDQGQQLLAEARRRFDEAGMAALSLETAAREIECLVLAGRPVEALERLNQLDGLLNEETGHPALLAMVERLRAGAVAQSGDGDTARLLLAQSETHGRAASVAYEIALTLDARRVLADRFGWEEGPASGAEADAMFATLGVVAVPPLPLRAFSPTPS